jgi:hypothetical protein
LTTPYLGTRRFEQKPTKETKKDRASHEGRRDSQELKLPAFDTFAIFVRGKFRLCLLEHVRAIRVAPADCFPPFPSFPSVEIHPC